MPHLCALGRHWRLGGDDIVVPAAFDGIFSATWFFIFSIIFLRQRHNFGCQGGTTIHNFYSGGILLTALNIAISIGTIHTSMKGTLINSHPRRGLGKLVSLRILMHALAVGFNVIFTKYAYFEDYGCEKYVVRTMQHAIKAAWGMTAASIGSLFFILIPKRRQNIGADLQSSQSYTAATAKKWNERMHRLGGLMGLEDHPAMTSLADLMTCFFKEDMDIVPSDILVAFMLLQKEQKERTEYIQRHQDTFPRRPLRPKVQPKPWMNIAMAQHYMKFAAGSYGWPMYVFSDPIASIGLFKVLHKSRYIPRSLPENIINDNSLLANTAVIKMTTGLRERDLIFITFHNKLFEIPFYVALDHKNQSIVVSIRGTLSLEDVLTDLTAFASERVPIPGLPDASVHEGMLHTARYLMSRLVGGKTPNPGLLGERCDTDETPLLEVAQAQLEATVGRHRAKEYKLVIVGHSLGAGVAAILSVLMRQIPNHENLRCFAFSPPGGLMSLSLARYCEEFVCSVVLGEDIVPRLGLSSAYDLKMRIFQIIRDCDTPKHKILGSWIDHMYDILCGVRVKQDYRNVQPSWAGDMAAQRTVEKYQMEIQRAIDDVKAEKGKQPRLYLPGSVLHIRENIIKNGWFKKVQEFSTEWADGESAMFGEILLTPNMLTHHMPWIVLKCLTQIKKQGKHSEYSRDC